jgi:macrodomain Ter protein organizer (MatP/YcbG family)
MLSSYSLPPTLFKVSGAIGKKYVIKQYKKGQVVTRYPDMSRIVPTARQKVRRRLFARAVRYAQSIYWKEELKAEWKRKLRRPKRLFQALMKQYYRQLSRKREQAESRILKWQRNVAVSKAGPGRFLVHPPGAALLCPYRRAGISFSLQLFPTEKVLVWSADRFYH